MKAIVFLSWGISARGEHRPVGSLSCSPPPGAVLWGFAPWQNWGYSCKCSSRHESFALISAVCLWVFVQCFWQKVWCRREGACWKMASESGINAGLGVVGLSVLFGESKTKSSAEFALAVLCFWWWLLSWEEKKRTWHCQACTSLAFANPQTWPLGSQMLQATLFSLSYNLLSSYMIK